jgi:AcrR family transcriptional regulator
MGRTRAALLEGAQRAVEKYGVRRTSMAELASVAGIAKGTLYNHFRTKDDVWAALIEHEITALADECVLVAGSDGMRPALERAADRLSAHAGLRRIAAEEPAVLARLVVVGEGRGWDVARVAVGDVLSLEADDPLVAVVLRWLVSFVGAPGREGEAAAGAQLLSAAVQGQLDERRAQDDRARDVS